MNNTIGPGFAKTFCRNVTLSWINTFMKPRTLVSRVEGLVIVTVAFLLILLVLGPCRRRSSNWLVQYAVRGAFLISFALISYTMGLMQGVTKNEMYPVWAAIMCVLFGGANSVSVQNLDENKQWLRLNLESLLYIFYLGSITGSIFGIIPEEKVYNSIRYGILLFLFGLLSVKNSERVEAMLLTADPLGSGSWTIERFMKYYEPVLNTGYNPRSLQGYNYLVLPLVIHLRAARPAGEDIIQIAPDEFVTLEKIWGHRNGVLSIDHPAIYQLRDVCLSFALFRLVVRRYFGYACAESGIDKTRDLVLQGLLPTADEQDCERAFRVIEVELGFLYDFFFTKYALAMYRGVRQSLVVSLLVTIFVMALGIYTLIDPKSGAEYSRGLWIYGLVETEEQDIIITKVALCAVTIFLLLEMLMYCSSDWAKASMVCNYITRSSWQTNIYIDKLLLLVGKFSLFMERYKWFRRWEHKIGQYSFLDSINHPGHLFLERRSLYMPIFRKGRKAGKSIPVPMEVKKAIAWTIKASNGRISDGAFSLEKHGMCELYWACQTDDDFSLTHIILTWHIATSYCEISEVKDIDIMNSRVQLIRTVATSLSKYCAHLIAFAPELIPGKPIETQGTLDELVDRARHVFRRRPDVYGRLRELPNDEGTEDILSKAAVLGMKLEILDRATRWRLLADFWAEMMLYIAPSDNVTGHIESLANGGEFVTHVWALLMHAGILERPAGR